VSLLPFPLLPQHTTYYLLKTRMFTTNSSSPCPFKNFLHIHTHTPSLHTTNLSSELHSPDFPFVNRGKKIALGGFSISVFNFILSISFLKNVHNCHILYCTVLSISTFLAKKNSKKNHHHHHRPTGKTLRKPLFHLPDPLASSASGSKGAGRGPNIARAR
jgi:hypothetical protein